MDYASVKSMICVKKKKKISQNIFRIFFFFNCWAFYSIWTRENILPWNAVTDSWEMGQCNGQLGKIIDQNKTFW